MARREWMLGAVPTRRERIALACLGGLLVLLTVLVAGGALTRFDQFCIDHLMPWLDPSERQRDTLSGYWRPFPFNARLALKGLDLVTYPCSLLVSALVVAWAGGVLARRGERVAALVPAAAWVVGNGVEVIGKGTITRPHLYGTAHGLRLHVDAFDSSFPSGHMLRGVVVAFALLLVRRRLWPWVVGWALLVGPALVVQAAHTPTDVIGGALVGLMLVIAGTAVARLDEAPSRSTRPRASAGAPASRGPVLP